MREILFRGKRIDNGEWVKGFYFEGFTGIPYILTMHDHILGMAEYYKVNPATVGQFTGLHDKNGKRIFEGDVVEMHQFLFDGNEYEHETKGAIKWGEYGWLLSQIEGEAVNEYMGYKNGEGETYFINFYGLHEESFEVIGTIHDEVLP